MAGRERSDPEATFFAASVDARMIPMAKVSLPIRSLRLPDLGGPCPGTARALSRGKHTISVLLSSPGEEALTIGPGGPARFVTDREVSPACEGLQASTIPKCHACEFLCKPFRPASGHEVADGGVCRNRDGSTLERFSDGCPAVQIDTLSPARTGWPGVVRKPFGVPLFSVERILRRHIVEVDFVVLYIVSGL
ncbi:hypothetical protein FOZ60_004308 [Perkinsus olseni]|uniref:Uncharacterized protein n=1 Tax=Perkinsus olseni TaxID=32597 RepID=A0A7J6NTG7_PEROL|nr:hypothetical protein FOZ60_004308 [Perkinsus olseni]